MSGRPAVFVDRDGTLVEEAGYLNHPSRVRLLPRSLAAVRRLNLAGVAVVVVTNQGGIGRGYLTEQVVADVHLELYRQLGGARLDGLYVCPHYPPEVCDCRKPRPGLLRRAAEDLGLDLGASLMVGDKPSDVAAGHAAGALGALVLTGYGRGEVEYRRHLWTAEPDLVADDLLGAAEWFLARLGARRSSSSLGAA